LIKNALIVSLNTCRDETLIYNKSIKYLEDFFLFKEWDISPKDLKFLQLAISCILGYKLNSEEVKLIHEFFVLSLDNDNIKLGGGLSDNQIGAIAENWIEILPDLQSNLILENYYSFSSPRKMFNFILSVVLGGY
jgi:hypothetical protein